jgi:hypothetical protein
MTVALGLMFERRCLAAAIRYMHAAPIAANPKEGPMPRTSQAAPAELPPPPPSPKRDRHTPRPGLIRRHGVASSAPPVVACALLLLTTEATMAQAGNAPVAIATEGAGPLGLGALVGAAVAGGFALIERFRQR